ncbi:Integrator complex subunit 2 [Podochytrium sp. JEL0797]|nr:Integrator complex subunit 2 [Podochytrium sp. JEL0797]
MRLAAAFVGYFKLKLTVQESHVLLDTILKSAGVSERWIQLTLCALIVGADQLIAASMEKFTQALIHVTQSDHSEFTLMTGVFCHTHQLIEVVNLIRSVLNVHVNMTPEGLSKLRTIFTDRVLNETDIARRSLSLRIKSDKTTDPNTNSQDIVVVHELLKAGIFQTARIDIKGWILESIRFSKPPYHTQFPDLIKLYVDSLSLIPLPVTVLASSVFSRISDIEVASYFGRAVEIEPYHVVLVFQVLYFNERYFESRSESGHAIGAIESNPNCTEYPAFVTDLLPFNRILLHMERPENREAFRLFYPYIASMVGSQYPHVVMPSSFLHAENMLDEGELVPLEYRTRILYDYLKPSFRGTAPVSLFRVKESTVAKVLRECWKDSAVAVACLEYLCALDPTQLLPSMDVIVNNFFPAVLVSGTNDRIHTLFNKLFQCLNSVSPRELWVKTINAWMLKGSVSNIELMQNPLLMFRVDERVFRIPRAFSVFLQILDCYLTFSRHYYTHAYQMEILPDKTSTLKESHLHALLDLQESAVLQALLELCKTPEENPSETELQINKIACSFLHERFVGSKKTMKLLHFQGYKSDALIPVVVENIPSMHVCFEFLPELIHQPTPTHQTFAIQLATALFKKYPIPASFTLLVNTVLPKIVALSNQISDTSVVGADQEGDVQVGLLKVFACLGGVVEAFPALVDKVEGFTSTLGHPRQNNVEFMKAMDHVRWRILNVKKDPERFNKITQRIK